ncbi:unnamed protein product, partial [Brenthis ino]
MKLKLKQLNIFSKDHPEESDHDEESDSESDYIEDTIGAVGVWQVAVCATASLTRFLAMGNMTSVVFLTPVTKFTCVEFQNNATINTDMTCYENCTKYDYHSQVMETTLISDFGLICEKSWLASLTQTILMLGLVIGVSLFGWMSDRYGRRVALLLSTFLNILSMIPTSFVTQFWMFNALRFVSGIASGGSLIICLPIVMENIGKRNKLSTTNIKEIVAKKVEALNIKENEKIRPSYFDFFRTKEIRYITMSTLCVWTVVGTTYYGIYQYVTLISDNIFITVAILGLMQLPLCPTEIVITKVFSRKSSLIVSLILTGITMLILIFTPKGHWFTSILGIVGFATVSVSFAIIYVYEAELYPTTLRNMAFGFASAVAKLGAMVAPFIANISPTWIPSAIFGSLSLVAAVSCVVLPETKGKNLKDTVNS